MPIALANVCLRRNSGHRSDVAHDLLPTPNYTRAYTNITRNGWYFGITIRSGAADSSRLFNSPFQNVTNSAGFLAAKSRPSAICKMIIAKRVRFELTAWLDPDNPVYRNQIQRPPPYRYSSGLPNNSHPFLTDGQIQQVILAAFSTDGIEDAAFSI